MEVQRATISTVPMDAPTKPQAWVQKLRRARVVVRRPHFQGRRAIAYLNHSGPLPRVGIRKLSICPKRDGIRGRSLHLLSLTSTSTMVWRETFYACSPL